ncbi:MAG: hypothetical protein V3T84_15690 [Phycisphaerales bacterium]
MATRAERQQALERMTLTELAAFEKLFGGTWYTGHKGDAAAAIESLLTEVEGKGTGDRLDRHLGLPTDAEQQLQLQRDGVEAAKSSGRAAWISAGCALIAVIIAVIALVVALQTK